MIRVALVGVVAHKNIQSFILNSDEFMNETYSLHEAIYILYDIHWKRHFAFGNNKVQDIWSVTI